MTDLQAPECGLEFQSALATGSSFMLPACGTTKGTKRSAEGSCSLDAIYRRVNDEWAINRSEPQDRADSGLELWVGVLATSDWK